MHEGLDLERAMLLGALALAGAVAGFFNTVAGAGSLLTVPALLLLGLPADVANATNRVGVLAQSAVGAAGFARAGKLAGRELLRAAPPAVTGGVLGAWLATRVPEPILKWVLLATLLGVAVVMARKGKATSEEPAGGRWRAALWLFGAGVYGGFVQAGVGLVLLAIFARGMKLDLVRANGLKVALVGVFTVPALAVFARAGTIRWFEGSVLALGTMAGAAVAVKFAVKRSERLERIALVVVIVAVVAAAARQALG
jgi:hypothetical protein